MFFFVWSQVNEWSQEICRPTKAYQGVLEVFVLTTQIQVEVKKYNDNSLSQESIFWVYHKVPYHQAGK